MPSKSHGFVSSRVKLDNFRGWVCVGVEEAFITSFMMLKLYVKGHGVGIIANAWLGHMNQTAYPSHMLAENTTPYNQHSESLFYRHVSSFVFLGSIISARGVGSGGANTGGLRDAKLGGGVP